VGFAASLRAGLKNRLPLNPYFYPPKTKHEMAEAIRMPLLSDTMKEGVIAAWHKKVGDKVKSDDVLADVETDKATMEVMPYVDGTLLYIGVEQGKAAKVNDIIAIVGKEGEDYKALLESGAPAQNTASAPAPALEAPKAPAAPAAPAAAPVELPKGTTVVRMPLLSDTMKEGKIVAWHKKVGDTVKNDDVLADVETDKATMEVMGYADGTLLYIGVPEGQAAPVNGIIAIIGKAGTDVKAFLDAEAQGGQQPAPKAEAPAAAQPQQSQPAQAPAPEAPPAPSEDGGRVKASPLARKLAKEKGINIADLKGTGDNGRIIKRDIDDYKPSAQAAATPKSELQTPKSEGPAFTDTPLSQMRRVIAQRLSESMFTAPHFYLRMTVTMDAAITARKSINDVATIKVSFNDLIIKASAMALRKHPEVNSSWTGDAIRQNHHINIGTAVAVDEGLIVPVVKGADNLSLSQIAETAGVLIDKARNKKLQPPEFTGNTFTISNLGMMDIDEFTAIINPPDSCILAVGKIAPTPVAENGQVVIRQLLKLTLSCDHRVVDGAVGARFLQTLKAYLENPVTMLA
jgi:pyruvate dehydrogenase E2 component (dihydrolipoamide acetyltransferase)